MKSKPDRTYLFITVIIIDEPQYARTGRAGLLERLGLGRGSRRRRSLESLVPLVELVHFDGVVVGFLVFGHVERVVADRGDIGCFVVKEGTEMTDGTQNISRGVEEQEEVVREGDRAKKRPKEI